MKEVNDGFYTIEKDYGDIVLIFPAYATKDGKIFIRRDCIENLPADISSEDMDVDTWLKLNYEV
jgi:hypothetical protein